mgnify:CR=1 FL=1
MNGWAGQVLDIDLTSGAIKTYPLDEKLARLFLGGRGLGARMLWDEVGPDVDALSPSNVLIFTGGPLTGTGYQTSNRFSVSTKSPLTGTVLDARQVKQSLEMVAALESQADIAVYDTVAGALSGHPR